MRKQNSRISDSEIEKYAMGFTIVREANSLAEILGNLLSQ